MLKPGRVLARIAGPGQLILLTQKLSQSQSCCSSALSAVKCPAYSPRGRPCMSLLHVMRSCGADLPDFSSHCRLIVPSPCTDPVPAAVKDRQIVVVAILHIDQLLFLLQMRRGSGATRRRTSREPSWTSPTKCSNGLAPSSQRAFLMWAAALGAPAGIWPPHSRRRRCKVGTAEYISQVARWLPLVLAQHQ